MRILFRHSSVVFLLALSFILTPAAHALGPSGDVYFGYSHIGSNAFYPNVGGLNGWQLTGHLKLMHFVGVEGDVAHYGLSAPPSIPRTTTVLFGPRVTVGVPAVHLFVHGLVGGEHSANSGGPTPISGGAMAVDFGGGGDIRIAPFFAWRVTADYLSAPTESPSGASHTRIGTGIVFRF